MSLKGMFVSTSQTAGLMLFNWTICVIYIEKKAVPSRPWDVHHHPTTFCSALPSSTLVAPPASLKARKLVPGLQCSWTELVRLSLWWLLTLRARSQATGLLSPLTMHRNSHQNSSSRSVVLTAQPNYPEESFNNTAPWKVPQRLQLCQSSWCSTSCIFKNFPYGLDA